MESRTLLLLGDVHGRFDHVLHEALSRRPAGVVFLGDIEPPRSMRELIAPLAEEGIQVWWIRGNHDTESVTTWSHLVTALDENLD
ncbi:metallophosphoesterase, partial [Acinetobacter baumannii]